MITVMVVEDEPLIMRSIKQMIEQTNPNFRVIGEAYDGEEALQIIGSLNPYVVFTDIKMPVMGGLALVSEMKRRGIRALPVILSGYKEFHYAQEALKLEVVDYILKPVSIEALSSLLSDIFHRHEAEMREAQLNILREMIQTNEMLSTKYTLQHVFPESKEFSHIFLCAGSFSIFPSNIITPPKEFWLKNQLEDIILPHLDPKDPYWILDGKNGNEQVIILGSVENLSSKTKKLSLRIYEDLLAYNFPITLIEGNVIKKIGDMGFYIQQSRILLNKSVLFAKSRIIESTNIHEDSGKEDHIIDTYYEKIQAIIIQNGHIDLYKQEFNKVLALAEQHSFLQMRLEWLLKQWVHLFADRLRYIPKDTLVHIEMEINELISNSFNYKAIYNGMCFIIDELFMLTKSKPQEQDSQKALADRIEQYLKSNYSNTLSLQSLGEIFGLVPPYLSRIYKECKGLSPTDHILQIRIEKAKELLQMEPPLLLKYIAEAIGYDDVFYFSRIFKSVTGRSPSDFRKEN